MQVTRRRRSTLTAVAAPLRSLCPIAGALDVLGDTWTLLVIRDLLFYDKHRFADFLSSPERIATNILTERLQRRERCRLVDRPRYHHCPPRDDSDLPAARGYDLLPVLRELVKWGKQHVPGVAQKPPAGAIRHPARPRTRRA
jgi:DNA-binding HxlR family transcriptional regulator